MDMGELFSPRQLLALTYDLPLFGLPELFSRHEMLGNLPQPFKRALHWPSESRLIAILFMCLVAHHVRILVTLLGGKLSRWCGISSKRIV